MFTQYVTALVISYVITIGGEPKVVDSVTYFQKMLKIVSKHFNTQMLGKIYMLIYDVHTANV